MAATEFSEASPVSCEASSESAETISVSINGNDQQLAAGLTVADWLAEADRDPRSVAIERNGEILPRGLYAQTELVDGDRLEVVQFVQGG